MLQAEHAAAPRFSPQRWIRPQLASNWCWAASVQSVLEQFGIQSHQQNIVSSLFGRAVNAPAKGASTLLAAIAPYRVRAYAADLHRNPAKLYEALRAGKKVMALTWPRGGHVVVFQGIDAQNRIIVSDPANGITRAYPLPWLYRFWRWHGSVVVDPPGTSQPQPQPSQPQSLRGLFAVSNTVSPMPFR